MGRFKEYKNYDGLEIADLIKKKEITASEVFEAATDLIETINPQLNAVITTMFDQAEESLQTFSSEGTFAGVPFLLKDLLAAYEGIPMTGGSKAFRDYIPDNDSELVRRFKKTGVLIMGKTNCPEFGLMGVTEPDLFGPTRNPWNLDYTPGGSSGGSAAAVAAGLVPIASAGDGGGSIRIPAAYCSLFGLKPSRGRVPTGPDHGEIWQGAVAEHIVSRSVRDSAAMLDCVQGADVGAPYIIPPPETPYLKELNRSPESLTIGFDVSSPINTPVDAECIDAVHKTAAILEKLGHNVEAARPDLDGRAILRSYLMMYFGEMAADLKTIPSVLGKKPASSEIEITTRILALMGRAFSAGDFVKELREWGKAARVMGKFHSRYDLFLTPTIAAPPAKIGELKPKPVERFVLKLIHALKLGKLIKASGMVDQIATESFKRTPFTQLANLTGQPAMSVPMHWTEDNLPIGVQFIAPFGDEKTLFRLASQLEQECPWIDKKPND